MFGFDEVNKIGPLYDDKNLEEKNPQEEESIEEFITVEIKRMDVFLKNIFKDIIKGDGFICGGFARYCCSTNKSPVKSSDIDIYCNTENSFEIIQNRLIEKGYEKGKESEISIGYSIPFEGLLKIQLIKPLKEGHVLSFGDIKDILKNFDFSIARCGIYFENDELKAIADSDFTWSEEKKKLIIKNIHCPLAQVYRVSKYMKKGYYLGVKEVLKIMDDWTNRDDDYKSRILEFLKKEDPNQEEIDELERMLHID